MQESSRDIRFLIHELKNIAWALYESAELLDEKDEDDEEEPIIDLYRIKVKQLQSTFDKYLTHVGEEKI